jgi:YfiH family protein
LNLGYSAGQAPSLVLENRRRLAAAAGFSLASWRGLRQAHGKRIVLVAGAGMGNAEPGAPLPEADGQITRDAGVTLITQHADCVPLYFLDPGRQAVGLAHAGWKGTLLDIAGAMVRAMGEAFGSRPGDLLVAIGPGAGPCHYEVDEPVLAPARERFAAMPGALESVTRPSGRPGRAWLDLWRANALLLTASGVLWERISVAGLCTICCNDRLFSHRQGDRGRQVAFIGLS